MMKNAAELSCTSLGGAVQSQTAGSARQVSPSTHETVIARLDYCAKTRPALSRIHEWEKPVQQLKYSAKLYIPWVSAAAAVEE